jgi:pimeloyl-ACP methyl ester carboxylesterase
MLCHLVLLLACLAAGCSSHAVAAAEQAQPPLVVVGGFADPFLAGRSLRDNLRERGIERDIVVVHPGFALSFDNAAEAVIDAVEDAVPSRQPEATVEVDVIGVSMGGLLVRHAAALEKGKRLQIRHLYTIASPHSGAARADRIGFFGTAAAMRSDSRFLADLALRERAGRGGNYGITQYAREHDWIIGVPGLKLPDHLADRGDVIWLRHPWWKGNGHWTIYRDDRILDDLVRRLKSPTP